MSATAPIRLLVVDDHPVVRAGLRSIEEAAPDIRVAGETGTADEALEAAARLKPDVVLLDIRLQGANGIEVCRSIKAISPATRVLILTSFMDEQLVLAALEAGADGYLLKESDTNRLVDAIRDVFRGEPVFDPQVTRQLAQARTGGATDGGPHALRSLSIRERHLLAEVAKGKTDKEVAATLGLTTKTARNYLDRIFIKMGVHSRTEAAMVYVRSVEPGR